jgi:hypothetical protein
MWSKDRFSSMSTTIWSIRSNADTASLPVNASMRIEITPSGVG